MARQDTDPRTDRQLRVALCHALGWDDPMPRPDWKHIRDARWVRDRWACAYRPGRNSWRWCLSWYTRRAHFGHVEWAETVTDPRAALLEALADLAVDPAAWHATR